MKIKWRLQVFMGHDLRIHHPEKRLATGWEDSSELLAQRPNRQVSCLGLSPAISRGGHSLERSNSLKMQVSADIAPRAGTTVLPEKGTQAGPLYVLGATSTWQDSVSCFHLQRTGNSQGGSSSWELLVVWFQGFELSHRHLGYSVHSHFRYKSRQE